MDREMQDEISKVKAVRVSVDWWELYIRNDDGTYTDREDGVSDGTQFWTLDAVTAHVRKVFDFQDYDAKKEHDESNCDVVWFHAVPRLENKPRIERSRKAVCIKRYLDAAELSAFLAGEIAGGSDSLNIEDVDDADDAQHAAKKQKTSDSE